MYKLSQIPDAVLNACRNLDMSDEEIARSTPKELFAAYLQWQGIIGYDTVIWDAVTKLSKLPSGGWR